jgi:hypothetical protein
MLCQDPPNLPWRETSFPNTYKAPVLRRTEFYGHVVLGFKKGRWVYGASITPPPKAIDLPLEHLEFKHQAPSTLKFNDARIAKLRAERLFMLKTYEWLLKSNP